MAHADSPVVDALRHGDIRLRARIRGAVQGVGFRPFIYWLADELGLRGWVRNSPSGVTVEVEGSRAEVETFRRRMASDAPPHSVIHAVEISQLEPVGYLAFEIRESDFHGAPSAIVLPDLATCAECRREIFDRRNRRHLYPFTNCTRCGPRFTIIEKLPYDRDNTSMRAFSMCGACRREYEDPSNRRFHAQPNACPKCGPQLALWNSQGQPLTVGHSALLRTLRAIREGAIVAVKGLGGFHLMVDARDDAAVTRLRARKHREAKPFAVMFPHIAAVRRECEVSPLEEHLLCSAEAPIVLLRRRATHQRAARAVAPDNPCIGALLPFTPLHHLLLTKLGFPVVATSGNRSEDPICIDAHDAAAQLGDIADFFLVHDRPIVRRADDSIVRVIGGREMMLRRARGYAPLPIALPHPVPATLALGAQLKNAIALAAGYDAFISQHIGDLGSVASVAVFRRTIDDFEQLFAIRPAHVVVDEHPDYYSADFAHEAQRSTLQHHCAHVLACMADNELEAPVLGVAWDGTGYAGDGTVWGGEFLKITAGGFERVAHFRHFCLPGGESAAREPRRSGLGVLSEIFGEELFTKKRTTFHSISAFTKSERETLAQMLRRGVNCPRTSSAGRLFDAVASILGLRQRATFEGQAAMDLEFAIGNHVTEDAYDMPLGADGVINWAPAVQALLEEFTRARCAAPCAAKFHNALAEATVTVAHKTGEKNVVLTGGCFQNKYLAERVIRRLREEGFRPFWHQRVPPNDGGIALGQIAAAARAHAELHTPAR
jgi:hydrogenase maturation protein HypF